MSKKSNDINIPKILSFERKLETSDGLMYAGNWVDRGKVFLEDTEKNSNKRPIKAWQPILIVPRLNRSTQSSSKTSDYDKTQPNPVASDSDDANLPIDKDTLKLSFSVRVIGNLGEPFACNGPSFSNAIKGNVREFISSDTGIKELAFRYAYNIVNGRFLWRNRVCAENIEIHVSLNDEKKLPVVKAYDFSLNDFNNRNDETLETIANVIKDGLVSNEEHSFVLIKVDAFVKLGKGQHVFPSQEMNMGEKKKKLFQLDGCAAMHNVKIGNAIRTIDTWYGDTMLVAKDKKGETDTLPIGTKIKQPIAIEPYGSVTQHGRAYRPRTNDLYSLMKDWVNNRDIEDDQKKYLVANLIRGGVFGGDSE